MYTVCFRANGGSEITPVQGKNRFVEWKKVHPFRGSLDGKQYIFDAPDGNVDRLTAVYQPEPVTLPETDQTGWSFGGWYYDSEFDGRQESGRQHHTVRKYDIVRAMGGSYPAGER